MPVSSGITINSIAINGNVVTVNITQAGHSPPTYNIFVDKTSDAWAVYYLVAKGVSTGAIT